MTPRSITHVHKTSHAIIFHVIFIYGSRTGRPTCSDSNVINSVLQRQMRDEIKILGKQFLTVTDLDQSSIHFLRKFLTRFIWLKIGAISGFKTRQGIWLAQQLSASDGLDSKELIIRCFTFSLCLFHVNIPGLWLSPMTSPQNALAYTKSYGGGY